MSPAQAYSLVLLTAFVAALAGVLAFSVLRFFAAARAARAQLSAGQGETSLMATAIQDAVDRLRAHERELAARAEASERLSDEIVASIHSGLLLVDAGGTVRVANPAAARLLGLGDAPANGRALRDVLASAPALADVVEEGRRAGSPIVRRAVTVAGGAPGSSPSHFGVTVSPVVHGDRANGAVICLFTDLTDVVEREEQVRLKESFARLGELTAGLAHEFRNGLATIHGYARLLDPEGLPAPAATYVRGIRAEAESLGEMVTNFLNFARPQPVALAPVDLGAVVGRVAAEWSAATEAGGGRIEVAGEFPTVEGDDVLLRQVLDNLCRNAVQACEAVGRVPYVRITGRRLVAERQVWIGVADNGPGIDPGAADRLFQPFFTTRGDGTGLGLAVVQKIVVTHNGRITATTQPEGGALFELRLPQASLQ